MNKFSTIVIAGLVALFYIPPALPMQRLQKTSPRQTQKALTQALLKRNLTGGCSVFKVDPKKSGRLKVNSKKIAVMAVDLHFEAAFDPSLGKLHRQQALRFLNFFKAKGIDTRYKIEHNKNAIVRNDSPFTIDVPVIDAQKHNMHAPPITYSCFDLRKPHDAEDLNPLLRLPHAQQSLFYEKLYNKALRIASSAKMTAEAKKAVREGVEEIYATNIAQQGRSVTLPQCMKLYSLPTDAYLTTSMIQDLENINHECYVVGHFGANHGVLPAETFKKLDITPTLKRGLLYRDEVERSQQEVMSTGQISQDIFLQDYLLEAQNHIEEQS